ncbi:MAG: hypothetical protein IPL39_09405 [Opitutaceae bacterium]|nr:hypothetical protein [Opitutaceae bacterium]
MPLSIAIKELHATTDEHVRRPGGAHTQILITDRGEPVAVLSNPALLKIRRRKRTLLPEFAALMARAPGDDVMQDLGAIRGDR